MRWRTILDDPRTPPPEIPRPEPPREVVRRPDPVRERGEDRRRDPAREREDLQRGRRAVRRPLTVRDRSERALVEVGIYRYVPFREILEAHFRGVRRTARREVNSWIREGLARQSMTAGTDGTPLELLSLTRKGASVARHLAPEQELDPGQEFTYTRHRHRHHLAHDAAIYRACRRERERLTREGARVRRVRLEAELQGRVLRRCHSARRELGQRAADFARYRAATELGLPTGDDGRVLYPDAQIEYIDADGGTGRLNVEVASANYSKGYLRARAAAGFRIHANGARAGQLVARLGPAGPGR